VALQPGDHRIIARLSGHREATAEVVARQGEATVVELTLEQIRGSLEVESTPVGARIRLDERDEELGRAPLRQAIPVGNVRVTADLDGYVTQSQEVTIRDGQTALLVFRLQRAAHTVAVLSVQSQPPSAVVLLDGEEAGRTPLVLDELQPGPRLLEVEAEGMVPWSQDLILEPGAATRAAVSLVPEPNRLWPSMRWLAWGSGAAILAAGAILGGLALWHHEQFYDSPNPTRAQLDAVRAESLAADILFASSAAVLATSLVLELVLGRSPRSQGTVTFDR
jgi:hypothetical protein